MALMLRIYCRVTSKAWVAPTRINRIFFRYRQKFPEAPNEGKTGVTSKLVRFLRLSSKLAFLPISEEILIQIAHVPQRVTNVAVSKSPPQTRHKIGTIEKLLSSAARVFCDPGGLYEFDQEQPDGGDGSSDCS